jgi:hypothetical protein
MCFKDEGFLSEGNLNYNINKPKFTFSSPARNGYEEAPVNGFSVVYPTSATVWPDAVLGIFSPNDPR